ncbi:MAG TPA: M48 family metalloprotease [Candidatus Acidoferrales bacterium]|nr:M48 family metalloprotease [Candidatus Acidoferrales bacterium]
MRKLKLMALFFALSGGVVCAQNPPAANPAADQQNSALNQAIDKIISREGQEMASIRRYSPLVETYIQEAKADKVEGWVPNGDRYFLGRAELGKGVALESLAGDTKHGFLHDITGMFNFGVEFLPRGFLQMIYVDTNGLDRKIYNFDYVRREFLGDVRTLVFDITPSQKNAKGRFLGRIWVEDQNFTIVRFNGGYTGSSHSNLYFHFDSWRVNTGPDLWLPAFIYSEENDIKFSVSRSLSFKAQTRLWGYNLGHSKQEQELSQVLVESNAPINDKSQQNNDVSPLQAQRSWDRQAEDNVVDRLERMGLVSPQGDVDKVLDTVINNIEVTNNLDIQPEVRCRVLMTSTMESFNLGHTIILSRGLIDVLPDEASLGAVLAQELAHVVLGHRIDTGYGFFDEILLLDEKQTFHHFDFARTKEEDAEASAKAAELLKNSPYKDQLKTTGLFVAELQDRSKQIPNLISPKLGNALLAQSPVQASTGEKPAPNQIVALPLGGRVKLDPWNDKIEMLKAKPAGTISEREKMPFEVTPFMPYLTRVADQQNPATAQAKPQQEQKPDQKQQPKPQPPQR